MIVDAAPPCAPPCAPTSSLAAAQYEALRTTALGETLAPDARSGLVLFLRRGMWAWAQALATAASAPTPSRSAPTSIATASDERRAVIHLVAALAKNALAMHTINQRTP